jgi:glutamate carboxypeptidase
MPSLLQSARRTQPSLLRQLQVLVEAESPSNHIAALTTCADLFADIAHSLVPNIKIRRTRTPHGPILQLDLKLAGLRPKKSQPKELQILVLGHVDTVWPLGTIRDMPFRLKQERAHGPGVRACGPGILDMKAGLLMFLHAVKILQQLDQPAASARNITLLVVPDEEIGSPSSRPITESLARRSRLALVLEPGTGLEGRLKTARKGIADYTVDIRGRAAHAGVDFAAGASAILEAAHQIERVAAFTNLARGTTVNPGLVSGGTATNTIAAAAQIRCDVRISRLRNFAALDRRFRTLPPVDPRCKISVSGGLNRPPMERTPAIARLFAHAAAIADEHLGLSLEESATGGGSDGNFTAALGLPTLDGLGAVGEGAHAPTESILLNQIAPRTALLAALLQNL